MLNRDAIGPKVVVLSCVVVICASCSDPVGVDVPDSPTVAASSSRPVSTTTWFDPASCTHDFGPILAGTSVARRHTYRLVNPSVQPVRIIGVVNRKPCCGDVEAIGATTLDPDAAVEIIVTLHIGLAAGRVVHLAELHYQDKDGKTLAAPIRTTGTGLARAVIEPVEPAPSLLAPGESARIEYLARSFGNRDRPPFPLDDRAIRCDVPTRWTGPAESRIDPATGLDEIRRPFAATVAASGEPGHRLTVIDLLEDGSPVGRMPIAYEVTALIRATPSGLIVAAGSHGPWTVVLKANQDRPFRVLAGHSTVEGMALGPFDPTSRPTHHLTIRLDGRAGAEARSGEIVVETDHPLQPFVKVAAYLAGLGHDVETSPKSIGATR